VSHNGDSPFRHKVGVDIGGTFTDLVTFDAGTGDSDVIKTFTTPHDPSEGFVTAIDRCPVSPADVETFITHGSTTAINTILTRRGAKVGFITTLGHRDTLDIGRAFREEGHLYDPSWLRPHVARPIIPRYLRQTVRERILADGSVLWPLDEDGLRATVDRLKEEDVEVIAVCFINSYVNPAHELRAREVIAEIWPDIRVELSSEIAPVPREYDRAITLALNSYVAPVVGRYLGRIGEEMQSRGYDRKLYVMQSPGGTVASDIIKRVPVSTTMSGPVAGVLGAQYLGQVLGIEDILTFDMGGTSTDVAAITGGELAFSKRHQIEWDIYSVLPMVEINSVGQGGGSKAWVDAAGALRVGPDSAGSNPGPACYGRGGEQATITDSNLLRGVIQKDAFVGGEIALDIDAARTVIERLGEQLDSDALETATGIHDIANANMIEAIRGVTIYKGIDPRDYTLLSYGSAGAQHISAIAGELGIRNVLIPQLPGAFSAFGLICSDVKVDLTKSIVRPLDDIDDEALSAAFAELEAQALASLELQGLSASGAVLERFMEGHYVGQTWETPARAPVGAFDAARREELVEAFHSTHERLWAFRADDLPIVVVNIRVALAAPVTKPELKRLAQGSGTPSASALMYERPVWWAGDGESARDVPFYDRQQLLFGDTIEGPAAVVEKTTTTLLHEGDVCRADEYGNLRITKESTR
jgi:N-methylhydantoinase A